MWDFDNELCVPPFTGDLKTYKMKLWILQMIRKRLSCWPQISEAARGSSPSGESLQTRICIFIIHTFERMDFFVIAHAGEALLHLCVLKLGCNRQNVTEFIEISWSKLYFFCPVFYIINPSVCPHFILKPTSSCVSHLSHLITRLCAGPTAVGYLRSRVMCSLLNVY